MTMLPIERTRYKAVQVILWGNLILTGLGFTLQTVLIMQKRQVDPNYEVASWVYNVSMMILFCSSIISVLWLKRSMVKSFAFYAIVGFFCVAAMIWEDTHLTPDNVSLLVFVFHMGIFALGVILNVRVALGYATATVAFLFFAGLSYNEPPAIFPAMILAYAMVLPSWFVDRLGKDLQQSEEKFGIVFRESLDVTLILDQKSGEILNANQAADKLLGYSTLDIIGHPFEILAPPQTELSVSGLLNAVQSEGTFFDSQVFQRVDGSLCPMDLTATLIPWSNTEALLVTLRDITERRTVEEELARYREHLEELVQERTKALEQTNVQLRNEIIERQKAEDALRQRTIELEARNEELDAFAHTVAHDLKNPLTSLVGFSKLLKKDHANLPVERLSYYLQIIEENGDRMTRIINELLLLASVSKMEDVDLEPLPMSSIVTEAQARLDNVITEAQAEIILPQTWPVAFGYGPWIEEVWANYISNAIKYGGHPPRVELGATELKDDDQICFWVRDNGVGLTPEEQVHLFKPFSRLDKGKVRGHGLGLSIVRRIVNKLGGAVSVESTVGEGSAFKFTLPKMRLDFDVSDGDLGTPTAML